MSIGDADFHRLLNAYTLAVSDIDHLLSKPVSGNWQRRWPAQAKAYKDGFIKHRQILAWADALASSCEVSHKGD